MTTADDPIFWDKFARKYAAHQIADLGGYERTLERTRTLLSPGDAVLELGCGTGSTALRLARGVKSYLATDLSPGMIEIAEEKLAAAFCPSLAFRPATAELLAQEDQVFDTVLGFNYLHLVADLPGTLDHIRSLTKSGGLFISKTPCIADMNPMIRLALPLMRLVGKAPHVSVFTSTALAQALTAAGFTIVVQERHGTKGKDARPFIAARKR
jgi:ubiquinone/menaquinone biosynthesis C-methylase UbiE